MEHARKLPLALAPAGMTGGIERHGGDAALPQAVWYIAHEAGDGLRYEVPRGVLAAAQYITFDLLVDGGRLVSFAMELAEGEDGPRFALLFAALTQCQARLRFPLEAVDQNRWRLEREGALLKPMCWGDRVSLENVDRLAIRVLRKGEGEERFCLTPVVITGDEPPVLDHPVLRKGVLLDELGQSTLHDWPGRSANADEVTSRLQSDLQSASKARLPEGFSRWGGCKDLQFEATGFFRVHRDERRWWLVDPDGCAFWSAGVDCVRVDTDAAYAGLEDALSWMPEPDGPFAPVYADRRAHGRTMNYLRANLIRAFGPRDWRRQWAKIALGRLRGFGFNTVGNWSEWEIAREDGFPYVRPLDLGCRRTPMVFRDFPDVFHVSFEEDAQDCAQQLAATRDDPALLGYFLMNEPTWGFADESPAAGMLFNTPSCATRLALREFLEKRHTDDAGISAAWQMEVTLGEVGEGEWTRPLTAAARADLETFSTIMVRRLFEGLSDACRRADPNHLNLGARYYRVPPGWALDGMRCFDVFSVNCYQPRIRPELGELSESLDLPVMVGEWHFGALDVGLPASGIGHVRDQHARGQAYRVYLEDAAAKPWCVGAHWFTLYDQSALGRFDGENYNIGFLDVCNRVYQELAEAARASHERLYSVAAGEAEPYSEEPEYLPLLFM